MPEPGKKLNGSIRTTVTRPPKDKEPKVKKINIIPKKWRK